MKIGILGGSSQVASSVAYYLKEQRGMDVVCFIRSKYSQAFFELLQIAYEHIDYTDKVFLKTKLGDCDVVLDFTYPTGQLASIKKNVIENISVILSSLTPGTAYIYMSSIMAHGMSPHEKYIKNYLIPRSSYAYIKRVAERLVIRLGKKYKLRTFNFRLGQVHGVLQSVNASFREKLIANKVVYVDGDSDELTNTIFIKSIVGAVLTCVNGATNPNTYTLVTTPQWTLKQLYDYYLDYYQFDTKVVYAPAKSNIRKWGFRKHIIKLLKSYRQLLETYVLMNLPSLAIRTKGIFRKQEVANLILERKDWEYIDLNLLGKPNGRILPTEELTFAEVKKDETDFENLYNGLILRSRK